MRRAIMFTKLCRRTIFIGGFTRSISSFAAGVLLALTVFGLLTPLSVVRAHREDDGESRDISHEQIAAARAATTKYPYEPFALDDGYISTAQCVEAPGLGGMGITYVNLSRVLDPAVDAREPEMLFYEPRRDGAMRLLGMAYIAPVLVDGQPWTDDEPPPADKTQAPELFGRKFDGPMPGRDFDDSWHYALHVWAWRRNPAGLFAPFNPKVRCD